MARNPKTDTVTAYKAFDSGFSCRGHVFEVGQTFTVKGDIKACKNGFHACEAPFDVLSHYPLITDDGSFSRFAKVTLSGAIDRHEGDSKIAAASITVDAELRLPDFIKAGVEWLIAATKGKKDASGDYAQIGSSSWGGARIGSSGDYAQIGSSGYGAQIGSSGYGAQIGSSGDCARIGSSGYGAQIGSIGDYGAQIGSIGDYGAQIGSSGDYAQIGSSGDYAQIGSSGYGAQIGSSGYGAQIGSSGDYARIGSSGYGAQIGSSGYGAQIKTEGANAVIASAGNGTAASGKDGTWLSLAEFDRNGKCVGFSTGCIGQDGLKPDTMYHAKGGKLVERGA